LAVLVRLATGSLSKGLMMGLGAYGGASMGAGLGAWPSGCCWICWLQAAAPAIAAAAAYSICWWHNSVYNANASQHLL
jgi:hypothetical protein